MKENNHMWSVKDDKCKFDLENAMTQEAGHIHREAVDV